MTITIADLTFDTIIGILEHERQVPQRVVVQCSFDYAYDNAFINYADVADAIKTTVQEARFELIEEALITLEETLISRFPAIEKLTLTLEKPDILPACRVSATHTKKFKKN